MHTVPDSFQVYVTKLVNQLAHYLLATAFHRFSVSTTAYRIVGESAQRHLPSTLLFMGPGIFIMDREIPLCHAIPKDIQKEWFRGVKAPKLKPLNLGNC